MRAKLPFFQTTLMANCAQTGVVTFSLPRLLSENIGTNGWVALFVCCAVSACNLLLISFVYRYSGGRSIFEIAETALPKFMLAAIFGALAFLWILLGSMVGKEYILILKSLSFPDLHPAYLFIIVELLVFLLLSKGILSISNMTVLPFFIFLMNVTLLYYTYNEFDLTRMTTFWLKGGSHSFKGWLEIYLAFLGYELSLLFFPYANKKTRLIGAFQLANLFTTCSYALLAFISFGFFSLHQLQHMKYPVLSLLSYVELPFVKRVDDLVFNLTLFRVIITNVLYVWAAMETLRWLLPPAKKSWMPYAIAVSSTLVTLFVFPSTLEKTEQWLNRLGITEFGVAFSLPFFLLILLIIEKYRGRKYA